MRERAFNDILPNLFDIAALYENHLYKSTGRKHLDNGTRVTWCRIPRPFRQIAPPRKRARQTRAAKAPTIESDDKASGEETEVDNTITTTHLEKIRQAQQTQNRSISVSQLHAPETPAPTISAGASSTYFTKTSSQAHHIGLDPNIYPSNIQMPYFTSDARCNQNFQQGDNSSVYIPSNSAGVSYEYEGAFPFPSIPHHSNMPFDGLLRDPNANY
jgi:hypothetical protein